MDQFFIGTAAIAFLVLIGVFIKLKSSKRNGKDVEKTQSLLNNVAIIFAVLFVLAIVTRVMRPAQEPVADQGEQTEQTDENNSGIIFNANEYAKISVDDLKLKMGEPLSVKEVQQGTKQKNIYAYDKNSLHYEFIVIENVVTDVDIYSEKAWNKKGEFFKYEADDKSDILKAFNLEQKKESSGFKNDDHAYDLTNISDRVDGFHAYDINVKDKTYGRVNISYEPTYKIPNQRTSSIPIVSIMLFAVAGIIVLYLAKVNDKKRRINRIEEQMIQEMKAQNKQ